MAAVACACIQTACVHLWRGEAPELLGRAVDEVEAAVLRAEDLLQATGDALGQRPQTQLALHVTHEAEHLGPRSDSGSGYA